MMRPAQPRLAGAAAPRLPGRRAARRAAAVVTRARRGGGGRQPSVAAPDPRLPFPTPSEAPLLWAAAAAALPLGLAALSAARSALRGRRSGTTPPPPPPPLSRGDAAALAAMAPLLLAGETAGGLDETRALGAGELAELELNLRMLVQSMDERLEALAGELEAALPPGGPAAAAAAAAAAALSAADAAAAAAPPGAAADAAERLAEEARWALFGALAPGGGGGGGGDPGGRAQHRPLLYNRAVQRRLLRQVEAEVTRRAEVEAAAAAAAAPAAAPAAPAPPLPPPPPPAAVGGLRLAAAGALAPHPDKEATGGEDAFFVDAAAAALGVADGVGGWAELGVDPAKYPRLLMAAAADAVAERGPGADPSEVLAAAFAAAHAPGSATVALAALAAGGALRVASLGDAGVRVVRGGAVVFATAVQEHADNQPFQLASPRHHAADAPAAALLYTVPLEVGDVVVAGSDGLFDNLSDAEVAATVAAAVAGRAPAAAAAAAAAALAAAAAAAARDAGAATPWAAERRARGGALAPLRALLAAALPPALGGKLDDVAAVVGVVH